MKFSTNTDFTKFPRAVSVLKAGAAGAVAPYGSASLAHDERHLRRRALELAGGDRILVDLTEPVALANHDRLVLEDGRHVEIIAAAEEVYDIRARDPVHLAELAWHIGNRHLPAAIGPERILILRDHVIKAMLEGLGATVTEALEPFEPLRGAYAGARHHAEAHSHSEAHGHSHDHHHGERDRYGRLPGDPHYGHNHG